MPDIVVKLEGVNLQRATLKLPSAETTRNTGGAEQQDDSAPVVNSLSINSAGSKHELTPVVTTEAPRLMVDNLNEMLGIYNVEARFFVDSRTDRRVVQLNEKPSNKLVRQVPSKDFLSRVTQTREYVGLIFDKKA